jgi:rfaE bifunctional protein kinase chain/domain
MESADSNLTKLADTRVLVVGDVMLDQYWMGEVRRISPEAPVPIISVQETSERLGGAGNVARNITALGGECSMLGIVGEDEAGQSINDISRKSGIEVVLEKDTSIKTTIKLRVVSKNQQLLRADFENSPRKAVLDTVLVRYQELIGDHDAVVLSDYGKGTLAEIESMIKIAVANGKPVLIDPKGFDYSRYYGATLITPNLAEFESAAGIVQGDGDLERKAASLIGELDLKHLLVTLSDKGMKLFSADAEPIHVPARSREVYDVSGAGDTVIAVMAMALSAKLPNFDGLELANSAAGIVISKLGTATTNISELRAAIMEDYQS